MHADQPLWNSKECEGKIVAIMRGPRPPSSSCGYGIKVCTAPTQTHEKNAAACVVSYLHERRARSCSTYTRERVLMT